MNYLLNFEEDEDYRDDGSGGGRKKKLLSKIRKRMSIVKKKRGDEDEEEEEDDDDSMENDNSQYGFLKRKMMERKQQKQQQQQKRQKPKEEKPRRKSLVPRRGMLSRGGSSRQLGRMSILRRKPSRGDESGNDAEEEEVDDVAMPLPGCAGEGEPDLKKLLDDKIKGKRKGKGETVSGNLKKRRFSGTGNSKKGKEKRSSGSSKGSKGSGASRDRQRPRRSKSHLSDRSVDSPPSVASTESSSDPINHKGAAAQHHAPRRSQGPPGLGTMPVRKPVTEENGFLEIEKMSFDYYYQPLPWVLKTWIYFVTVVVPFTFLYYFFIGIFHSTALQENKFLQKVYFANVLFGGLGCTFKTGFWANQTVDSRGIHSSYKRNYTLNPHPTSPLSPNKNNRERRLPGRARTKSRDGLRTWSNNISNISTKFSSVPKNAANGLLRSGAVPSKPRTRRNTMGSNYQLPDDQDNNNSNSLSNSGSNHQRSLSMGNPPSSSSGGGNTRTASATPSTAVQMETSRGGNDSGSNLRPSAPMSPGGVLRNGRAPRRTAGGTRVRPSNEHRKGSNTSVWDEVESMIQAKKKPGPTKARPKLDKNMSIMEICDFHASDEKNVLLQ